MSSDNYSDAPAPAIGSIVLVRFSFNDEEGNTVETKDFFGRVTRINSDEVVLKNPNTGEEVTLPPYFGSYQRPPKGVYDLPSTGEKVTDPDYITEWTLRISSAS